MMGHSSKCHAERGTWSLLGRLEYTKKISWQNLLQPVQVSGILES